MSKEEAYAEIEQTHIKWEEDRLKAEKKAKKSGGDK